MICCVTTNDSLSVLIFAFIFSDKCLLFLDPLASSTPAKQEISPETAKCDFKPLGSTSSRKDSTSEKSCDADDPSSQDEADRSGVSSNHSDDDRPTRKKHPAYSSMCYSRFEGRFTISRDVWETVWDWNKNQFNSLHRRKWIVVFKSYIRKFRPRCKLQFRNSGVVHLADTGCPKLYAYVRCGTGNCKQYALSWEPKKGRDDIVITVFSSGDENHEKALTKTTQLRGAERELDQKHLKKDKAHKHKLNIVTDLNPDIVAENNWQNLKSDAVFRKARSQVLQEEDFAKDDFFDVVLMMRDERQNCPPDEWYIQSAAEPMSISLFAERVLRDVFNYYRRKGLVTVHLDATGQLVRRKPGSGDTVYLYSGVVSINATLVPLFNFISARHDAGSIGVVLSQFKTFCENSLNKKWPCIGRVVLDCSFALILAVMRQWNGTSLAKYLTSCFNYCNGQFSAENLNSLVVVRLCKNHWTKMNCRNCTGHLVSGKKKTVIVEVMSKLIDVESMNQFDAIFSSLVVILLSKVKHQGVIDAFDQLNISPRDLVENVAEPDVENIADAIDEHTFTTNLTLYDTPFHLHCLKEITKISENLDKHIPQNLPSKAAESLQNPFYCPEFLYKIFLKNHYAALVPLWTSVMDELRGKSGNFVASNGAVESYFDKKKDKLHDVLKDKPSRFIRKDKKYTFAAAKTVSLKLRTDGKFFEEDADDPNNSSRPSSKSNSCITVEEEKANETWKPGRETKFTYSQGKTVKRVSAYLHGESEPASKKRKLSLSQSAKPRRKIKKGPTLPQFLKEPETWFKIQQPPSSACEVSKTVANCSDSFKKIAEEVIIDSGYQMHSFVSTKDKIKSTHYKIYLGSNISENGATMNEENSDTVLESSALLFTYGEDKPVYGCDLQAIMSSSPLTTSTVDACIYLIERDCKSEGVFVGSFFDSRQIFYDQFSEKMAINAKNVLSYRKLLLPICRRKHWILAVVDIVHATFSLLDPVKTDDDEAEKLLQAFTTYSSQLCHIKNTSFVNIYTILAYKHIPRQKSDNDCGVYVLHYIRSLLQSGKCTKFNSTEFRKELGQKLKEASQTYQATSLTENGDELQFKNGLKRNIAYYASDVTTEFVVCQYGNSLAPIFGSNFRDLLSDTETSNWVIDTAIFSYMGTEEKAKFVNVRAQHSYDIMTGKVNSSHILWKFPFKSRIALMPLNMNNNHWCLVVANFESKSYQCFDPINMSATSAYFSNFVHFLKKSKFDYKGWQCLPQDPRMPTQTDGVSCGIFVILYAITVMGLVPITESLNLQVVRRSIAYNILENCPNMSHLCLKCGKDEYARSSEDSIVTMVQCNVCERWLHFKCCRPAVDTLEDDYECFLCKAYA